MAPVQAQSKHIPPMIEDDSTVKVIEDKLERHLTDLRNPTDENAVVELVTNGTIHLIVDTFEALKHSTRQESLFDIIDRVIDIFMAANEAGKEAKKCLILGITENCMDLIISPTVILIHKIEILKSFNTVLENCSAATKCDLLVRTQFTEKLSLLFKSISQVGDYEVQVCIIEFMFRLVPKNMRKEYLKSVLDDCEQWQEFLGIQDNRFEIDCRRFLNKLNKQNSCPMTRVYSYPAEFVSVDGVQLQKPSDDGYDDFWVDFNEGSKRIGIFCESIGLSSQQSENVDQLWETVSIWAQDVKNYSCSTQGKLVKAVIELKPGTEMLSNKDPDNKSHFITIVVHKKYDLKGTIMDVLKINRKASSVDIPICVVQKQDMQIINSTSLSKNPVPRKLQTLSQQKGAGSVLSVVRSKTSIPSEPMTSPASSIITSTSEHPNLWQEVQERQKQQKEKLAKVLGRSGWEEKNKANMTEAANRVKGNETSTLEGLDATSITTNTSFDKFSQYGMNNTSQSGGKLKSNTSFKNLNDTQNVKNIETDEKGKDKASENTKVSSQQSKNKSQAKVKASEKCTDMTLHYMDARASDAHVNVVNSSVTDEGDDNFRLHLYQTRHSSRTKATKCVPKLAPEKVIQDMHKENVSKLRKSSTRNSLLSSTTFDADVHSKCDSNPSQLDVILGTLPGAQQPDRRQLRAKREPQKTQGRKTQGKISDDGILESKASSTYEENKSDIKKNKPKQIKDEGRKSYSKNNKVVTNKVQNAISPGNTSVEDFKPSKNFRTLRSANRKVAEKTENRTASGQIKANGNRTKQNKENTTFSKHVGGTGEGDFEDSGARTLKEFLQEKKAAHEVERNKITVEVEDVLLDTHNVCQQTSLISADLNSLHNEPCTKAKETFKTSDGEKLKEPKSVSNKNSMQSVVISPFSSGELIVETTTNIDEDCNVIKETQFEISPPFSFDDFEVTDRGKKQKSCQSPQQSEESSRKSKLDSKLPNASGDYISSHLGMQMSSNVQSSFVFTKQKGMKENSVNAYHVECEEKKTENTKTQFQSPNYKTKNVLVKEGAKEKDKNCTLIPSTKTGLPTEKDDTHEKICVKKTIKAVKIQEFSQSSSCSLILNQRSPIVEKQCRQISSKSDEATVPARKLRARKKTVAYKECNSDCFSFDTGKNKNASQVRIKKNKNITAQKDVSSNSAVPVWSNVSKISCNERMNKSQTERYSMNVLGLEAPKKSKKGHETNKHIWTSHRMEKTITTMSYAKSLYSASSDPYDFEAECKKRPKETPVFAPFRSSFSVKHSSEDKMRAESSRVHYKKQGTDKSQLQSSCSRELLQENASVNNASRLEVKQHFKQKRNVSSEAGNKHCSKSDSKKNVVTSSGVGRQILNNKGNKTLSFEIESDGQDSDRGLSKFALFASQYEANKSDSGLVFPHLDDSIPCTPIQEDTICEESNTAERKSVVSDLSWLAQAKRSLEKQEQNTGKTYKRSKSAKIKHLATSKDEDLKFGPQHSSLNCKQSSRTPSISNQTPKPKKKDGIPCKRKLFSPLDIRTMSGKSSSVQHPEFKEQNDQRKNSCLVKEYGEGILASFLKNSAQKLDSLHGRRTQTNISVKSASINESSGSELNESFTDDNNYSLSKSKNKRSNLKKSDSERSSFSTSNLKHRSIDSYSLISSKIDQQLQDVIQRLCANEDYHCPSGNESGPSSCIRPTRAELKRKYPSVSSTINSGDGESDTEDSVSAHAESGHNLTCIPRKLFKSDMTAAKSDQTTASVNQTRKFLKGQTDNQISSHKSPFQTFKKNATEKKTLFDQSSETKSCGRRLEQLKYVSHAEKFDEKFTSTPQIGCSEKVRSHTEPSRPEIETSPVLPLDLSSSNSPVIGFSEKSSAEPDRPLSTLLDTIRKELMKPTVSQFSEELEQTMDTGTLDFNETINTEFDSLKEFLIKKRTKKTQPDSDDLQGAVKSTHQYITSLWETEQSKRMSAIEKFQCVAKDVFTCMNKDLKELHETEVKATLLWTQEMEKVRKYNLSRERELKRLKKAHEKLICELQRVQAESETSQKSLKTAMKQDLNALQRKLAAKYNEHALEAMKRCLQVSFLS